MAKWTYESSLTRLLAHEGGYTNHPADPGGPTNFGITIADYRRYVKPDATAADVKAMAIDDAKRIYRAKYWDAQRCDDLPAGVDYAVFDYGVNSGIGRSKKVLQRVLGVKADGVLGPKTMGAVRAADPKKIINAICDERILFLHQLRTWPVFGKGWTRRVREVRDVALGFALRMPDVTGACATSAPTAGKGVIPAPVVARNGTAGGALVIGAAAAQQAQASGLPTWAVACIAGIAIAAAIAAVVFWQQRHRRAQEAPA